MLRTFVLTLFSSWLVSPLGILTAQYFGVANAPIVILSLLATGSCVPFQLLLNECLAVAATRGIVSLNRFQMSTVLLTQLVSSAMAIFGMSAQAFKFSQISTVVILLSFNTFISYQVSITYYGLVMRNMISREQAMIIGSASGLTNLCLYLMFCISRQYSFDNAFLFILATLLVPTLIQWLFVRSAKIKLEHYLHNLTIRSLPSPRTGRLLLSLAGLSLLTTLSTNMRETIASSYGNYLSLILVLLNSLLTLINTITRTNFLSKGASSKKRILCYISISTIVIFFASKIENFNYSMIFLLISAQAMIAWIIDASRSIPAALRSPIDA